MTGLNTSEYSTELLYCWYTVCMEEQKNIQEQLEIQQQALAKIYKSVEKTRKYILWSVIGTLVTLVVPLIIIAIVLPRIINTFQASLGGLM